LDWILDIGYGVGFGFVVPTHLCCFIFCIPHLEWLAWDNMRCLCDCSYTPF
jgi:hypothetical protein